MAHLDLRRQSKYEEDLSELNKEGSGDFIRLLKVISVSEKHITCDLRVFPLKNAPPYAALSYCWGNGERDKAVCFSNDPREDDKFECNRLAITTHLFEGLRRLSVLNEFGWLWNDAICINQELDSEKNDQVARMQSIYSNAKRVYVWLGMGSFRTSPGGLYMTKLSGERSFARAEVLGLLDRGSNVWWKRLWIVQELCLCADVQIVLRNACMEWSNFVASLRDGFYIDKIIEPYPCLTDFMVLSDRLRTAKSKRLDIELVGERDTSTTQKLQHKSIREDAALRELAWLILLLDCVRRTCLDSEAQTWDMYGLLRITGGLESEVSNPLDRIYALLGLTTVKARENIPIKYSSKLIEVFGHVAAHLLEEGCLEQCYWHWSRGTGLTVNQTGLPTWMPDFSIPITRENTPKVPFIDFAASGDIATECSMSEATRYLHTKAIRCGTVSQSHARYSQGIPQYSLQVIGSRLDRAIPLQSQQGALASSSDFHRVTDVLEREMQEGEVRDSAYIFRTDLGLTGISIDQVENGDEVILPIGFDLPWIIRPWPHDSEDSNNDRLSSLIGQCYVEGIMEGELVDIWKKGEVESTTYVIR